MDVGFDEIGVLLTNLLDIRKCFVYVIIASALVNFGDDEVHRFAKIFELVYYFEVLTSDSTMSLDA